MLVQFLIVHLDILSVKSKGSIYYYQKTRKMF